MLSNLLFATRKFPIAIHYSHKGKESQIISFLRKIINFNHMSLTEYKSGTTQNLPFWVNSRTEVQKQYRQTFQLIHTPLNAIIFGYCCIMEVNGSIKSKSAIFGIVVLWRSIAVLNPNQQYLDWASIEFSELFVQRVQA